MNDDQSNSDSENNSEIVKDVEDDHFVPNEKVNPKRKRKELSIQINFADLLKNMMVEDDDQINYESPKKKSKKEKEIDIKIENGYKELEKYMQSSEKNLSVKEQILVSNLDIKMKAELLEKMQKSNETEYNKLMAYTTDLLTIPLGIYKKIPASLETREEIVEYFNKTKQILDEAVYGNENAKDEIMDFIARRITNPDCQGNVIALVGSCGSGKTRLVRQGIAKALSLPFKQISFGGLHDGAILTGHDNVYIGSHSGKIAQILIEAECMNPIIYLDEIDKIGDSVKSIETYGVLTHMLDQEQNMEFEDLYLRIKLDLSKVLFIVSLNNIDAVDSVVRDRLKIIYILDPSTLEKICIAKKHMIPDLFQTIGIKNMQISDDVIKYILNQTEKEPGVRKFKKNLESVFQKANTCNLLTGIYPIIDNDFVLKSLKNSVKPTYLSMYI